MNLASAFDLNRTFLVLLLSLVLGCSRSSEMNADIGQLVNLSSSQKPTYFGMDERCLYRSDATVCPRLPWPVNPDGFPKLDPSFKRFAGSGSMGCWLAADRSLHCSSTNQLVAPIHIGDVSDLFNVAGIPYFVQNETLFFVTSAQSGSSLTLQTRKLMDWPKGNLIVQGLFYYDSHQSTGTRMKSLRPSGKVPEVSALLPPDQYLDIALNGDELHASICGLKTDGLYCWGSNFYGESPTFLPELAGATKIVRRSTWGCALMADQVRCWGSAPAPIPAIVDLPGVFDLVVPDWSHQEICGVTAGGIRCWGPVPEGQFQSIGQIARVNVNHWIQLADQEGLKRLQDLKKVDLSAALPNWPILRANWNRFIVNSKNEIIELFWIPSPRFEIRGTLGGIETLSEHEGEMCLSETQGIRCWGRAISGYPEGELIEGLRPTKHLAVGGDFACAHQVDHLKCWGVLKKGIARKIATGATIEHLSANKSSICWSDGQGIKCHGELPNHQIELQMPHANVRELALAPATFAGCALDNLQKVHCWNSRKDLDALLNSLNLKNPRGLSFSDRIACVVDDDGLKCVDGGPRFIPHNIMLWHSI